MGRYCSPFLLADSFTDWLAVDLLWSLRGVVQRFILRDLATLQPIEPPFGEELHHRNETLVGLTDPWLSVRAGQQRGPWSAIFRIGATLPVGNTVPNPFELAREGKVHEHIQFGTGTVDPFIEWEVRRLAGRFTIAANMLGKFRLRQDNVDVWLKQCFNAGANLVADLAHPLDGQALGVR